MMKLLKNFKILRESSKKSYFTRKGKRNNVKAEILTNFIENSDIVFYEIELLVCE